MGALSSPVLLVLFVASAGVIWIAGIKLSDNTDVLAERLHLGSALGGLILLAIATNLPEIAITGSAAMAGQLGVAVGNILGGIAIQTVVLVVLDAAGVRPRAPLTRLAASLALVLEGALVVIVLAVVVMGTQLSPNLVFARLAPASVVIAALWVVGLVLLNRAGKGLPWREGGDAPDSQPEPRGHSRGKKEQAASDKGVSTTRAALVFGVAAIATLVAGVIIERSGEEFFRRLGLSGIIFGATVLAAATSLPELSTGLTSTRLGDYKLAISDIFGGNAFLPVLFLLATLLSGKPVLPDAHKHRHLPDGAGHCPHDRVHDRIDIPPAPPIPAHGHRQYRRAHHLPHRHRGPRHHRKLACHSWPNNDAVLAHTEVNHRCVQRPYLVWLLLTVELPIFHKSPSATRP